MYKHSLFAISALAILSTNVLANTDTKKLDEVVVTAKSDKKIEDLSSSVTVITAEDIAKLNATNVKDILVKQAGIVQGANEFSTYGRQNISIRGLDSSYSLILIDGRKINPTDGYIKHSDFEYSWLPVEMIERIEVIKGPKSSIYGSQAMGGVINIITKKDSTKGIWGEIDIQGGLSNAKHGGDETKGSVNLGGNISDKFSIALGVTKSDRDESVGPNAAGTATTTYLEGLETLDGNLRLKYNFDETQNISASYIKGKETRKIYNNPKSYEIDRDLYGISYEKRFESVAFNVDYTRAESDSRYRGGSSDSMNYIHNLTTDSLKGEVKISALKYNYIVLGAETAKENYKRKYPISGTTKYDFEARTNSYYVQDEIELQDFVFTLGTRLDDSEKFGNEWSSNVGAVYKIDDKQRLKLSYGEGFKTPSLQESSS